MRQYSTEIEVRYYVTDSGHAPFVEWLEALKDQIAKAKITVRLNRLRRGLFGDTKALGGGLEELRINYGPGYRIYYGRIEDMIVLLLCGGTKDRQRRDVYRAMACWSNFLETHHDKKETKKERGL